MLPDREIRAYQFVPTDLTACKTHEHLTRAACEKGFTGGAGAPFSNRSMTLFYPRHCYLERARLVLDK